MSLLPSDFSFCSTDRRNGEKKEWDGEKKLKWNSGGME